MWVYALLWGLPSLFIIIGFIAICGGHGEGFLMLAAGIFLLVFAIKIEIDTRRKMKKQEAERARKKLEEERKWQRHKEINQRVKEGKWVFPAEDFYRKCRENHIEKLDSEFSVRKATQIAETVIKEANPDIFLDNCKEYLKKTRLEEYLYTGRIAVKKEEERPRNANPNKQERTFIRRAKELSRQSEHRKRMKMLEDMASDYKVRIDQLREGEEALMQLGMIYADQRKKETSWAVMGGIAEGIAGSAAGIMAAANTMENNRTIREYNASMRKASMDIVSGIPDMMGDRIQLETELAQIEQQLSNIQSKVTLKNPSTDEIWENIQLGKPTIKKKESGVLAVSLPVAVKKPFVLDVPEGVLMVLDGTIKGEVWFEDNLVGEVFFPLPIYGIPSNMTAEVTLDGMCGRSVGFDGEYTVKIADTQNLWIMEA